ncbi:MAG: Ku protein [Pirellulaceae bacterium]
MTPRPSWKGYFKLSLVSIPVKGYSANTSAGHMALNQLHEECHSRIKYQKTCPIHGEVTKDEIVSGYEYTKGQYVVIEPDEIDKLRTDADRAINVDAIIPAGTIDPLYFTERAYYLVPDGDVGQKAYALVQHCLVEDHKQAIARVVLFGREELVLVRPVESLLSIGVLKYAAQLRNVNDVIDELESPDLAKQEVELTKSLLKALSRKKFSLESYKDEYVEKLTSLIEAKVAGKDLVTPPQVEAPQVINLMEALRKSVASAQKGGPSSVKGKKASRRKMAPGARPAKTAARAKRKSG